MNRTYVAFAFSFAAIACARSEPEDRAPIQPELPVTTRANEPVEVFRAGTRERDPTAAEINRLQYSECEPGETRSCGVSIRADGAPLMMHCRAAASGALVFDRSDCATPIVIAFGDAPVRFTRAPAIFSIGPFARTEWVSAATPWLALDRDGTGCVENESELFAFEKLARLDANHDGRIDAADPAFADLALWYDRDQDKRCSAGEMVSLAAGGIVAIDLAWTATEPSVAGSHEGERAAVELRGGTKARAIDVYLAPL